MTTVLLTQRKTPSSRAAAPKARTFVRATPRKAIKPRRVKDIPAGYAAQTRKRDAHIATKAETTFVSNSEQIAVETSTVDIGNTNPQRLVLSLNPGNSSIFPYLAAIASKYAQYRFTKLSFEVRTRTPTTVPGNYALAFELDPGCADPETFQQLLMISGSLESPAYQSSKITVKNPPEWKYVSRPYSVTVADPRTIDWGKLFWLISTTADDDHNVMLSLIAHYTVEFRRPVFSGATRSTSSKPLSSEVGTSAPMTSAIAGTMVSGFKRDAEGTLPVTFCANAPSPSDPTISTATFTPAPDSVSKLTTRVVAYNGGTMPMSQSISFPASVVVGSSNASEPVYSPTAKATFADYDLTTLKPNQTGVGILLDWVSESIGVSVSDYAATLVDRAVNALVPMIFSTNSIIQFGLSKKILPIHIDKITTKDGKTTVTWEDGFTDCYSYPRYSANDHAAMIEHLRKSGHLSGDLPKASPLRITDRDAAFRQSRQPNQPAAAAASAVATGWVRVNQP